MTNADKNLLRRLAKDRSYSEDDIKDIVSCHRSTIRRYIMIFRHMNSKATQEEGKHEQ